MDDALKPETSARIDELCRKITVAHTLDDEIQEELRDHIEDRLLDYLRGEEALSQDEAFILVREHFGDPANLKAQLQDVHLVDTHVSLARRLAAIIAVHLVYTIVSAFVAALAWTLIYRRVLNGTDIRFQEGFYSITVSSAMIIATIGFAVLLYRWEGRIRAGHKPWFLRERGLTIVLILGALFVLHSMVPTPYGMYDKSLMPLPAPVAVDVLSVLFVLTSVILHAVVWLWWCDRPPRRPRTVTYAALVWLALSVFPLQTTKYVQLEVYGYEPGVHETDLSDKVVLWEEPYEELSMVWSLRRGLSTGCPTPSDLMLSLVAGICLVALAKQVYERLPSKGAIARFSPPDAST